MDYEATRVAVDAITKSCTGSEVLSDLQHDLFRAAVRYANLRAQWCLEDFESRREMDDERTRAHNAFIDSCNILSRNMAREGLDTSWRADLGDDRKTIGDFACYVHTYLGLSAR